MPSTAITLLDGRGVVAVRGGDAVKLLQGLLTNDLDDLDHRPALAAGLLSPQGKILFEVIVYGASDGLLIETSATAEALARRLALYKLRAEVAIADETAAWLVVAAWDGPFDPPAGSVGGPDPRLPDLGTRWLVPAGQRNTLALSASPAAYHARRVARGVSEASADYVIGDTFPHEADFDLRGGVSFTKGCYVGQEVVARMHHKTVVRKRVVRVHADRPLEPGADIVAAGQVIGRIGTVDGAHALAFLKLDRADELAAKGEALTAGDAVLHVDANDLAPYLAAKAKRP